MSTKIFVTMKFIMKCLSYEDVSIEVKENFSNKMLQDKSWNNLYQPLTLMCEKYATTK